MTDNGSPYVSHAFRDACAPLGLRHLLTRPYTPRTNGKAERFNQMALREWACAATYRNSRQRRDALGALGALSAWLHHNYWHRPHSALNGLPPVARLGLATTTY